MRCTYEVTLTESVRPHGGGVRVIVVVDHPAEERAYRVAFTWDGEEFRDYETLETWGNECEPRPLTADEQASPALRELFRFLECDDDLLDSVREDVAELARDMRADNDFDAWRSSQWTT
jgi:hypothetical protein